MRAISANFRGYCAWQWQEGWNLQNWTIKTTCHVLGPCRETKKVPWCNQTDCRCVTTTVFIHNQAINLITDINNNYKIKSPLDKHTFNLKTTETAPKSAINILREVMFSGTFLCFRHLLTLLTSHLEQAFFIKYRSGCWINKWNWSTDCTTPQHEPYKNQTWQMVMKTKNHGY